MEKDFGFESDKTSGLQMVDSPQDDYSHQGQNIDRDQEAPQERENEEAIPEEVPETDEVIEETITESEANKLDSSEITAAKGTQADLLRQQLVNRGVDLPGDARIEDIPADLLEALLSVLLEKSNREESVEQIASESSAESDASVVEESPFVVAADAALGPEELSAPDVVSNVASDADDISGSDREEQGEVRDVRCRSLLSERIRRSKRLPKGLRERLTSVVDTVQFSDDGREQPTLSVSDTVSMIEQSMPPHMQIETEQLEQPRHPGGDVFFSGDPGSLSDEEAERIAKEQLASSGFASRHRES